MLVGGVLPDAKSTSKNGLVSGPSILAGVAEVVDFGAPLAGPLGESFLFFWCHFMLHFWGNGSFDLEGFVWIS